MKKLFCSILRFFNLVDRNCNLSITNIAVIVLITKMALAATIDWGVVSGLLITLINYGHKRHESNKAEKKAAEMVLVTNKNEELEKVKAELETMKPVFDKVLKQSEDLQKVLNNSAIMGAFGIKKDK